MSLGGKEFLIPLNRDQGCARHVPARDHILLNFTTYQTI